jgi:Domain of unknown function (DUF3883)
MLYIERTSRERALLPNALDSTGACWASLFPLPQDVYEKILDLAGIPHASERDIVSIPDLAYVRITETDSNLLLPRTATLVSSPSDSPTARYSRNAAPIGRRAEELVNQYIMRNADILGARNIRWVADEGSTPGWDLQYENEEGDLIAVEVKGTTAPQFGSIDITAGEWNAAQALGDHYWFYLVANCGTTQPVLQRVRNPVRLLESGAAQLVPVVYRFTSVASMT